MIKKRSETHEIAVQTKSRHLPDGYGRNKTPGAKLLPGMNVGEVDLHRGQGNRSYGIADCDASVGKRSRVDENAVT